MGGAAHAARQEMWNFQKPANVPEGWLDGDNEGNEPQQRCFYGGAFPQIPAVRLNREGERSGWSGDFLPKRL